MEWRVRMNSAIDYIEEHLLDEIDFGEVASRAFCSSYHFQRIFSVVLGVSLGEYIRRRRLSLAAQEVSSSNTKIIDIAMNHGYDSPDSFTRAFRSVYGVTPTEVRRSGPKLAQYPLAAFQSLPSATWAIFEDKTRKSQELLDHLFGEWFPTTSYELSGAMTLEVYMQGIGYQLWLPIKAQTSHPG